MTGLDDLRAGKEVRSTRGPRLCTWREAERVLAGFPDGRADEGPAAGPASLVGLGIARERGWTAPDADAAAESGTAGEAREVDPAPAVPTEKSDKQQAAAESDDEVAEAAQVEQDSPTDETAAEKEEGK